MSWEKMQQSEKKIERESARERVLEKEERKENCLNRKATMKEGEKRGEGDRDERE
jgi:hypothetical protein